PYVVDFDGDNQGTLYVKDLGQGAVRKIRADDVKASSYWKIEWGATDTALYYAVPGTAGRDTRVARADLSGASVSEESVYDELDTDFYLNLSESASGRYILLQSSGTDV